MAVVHSFFLIVFIFSGVAVADIGGQSNSSFSVLTTVEYQQISQEFYNDSVFIDTTTFDVLETWSLSHDKIEDLIFRTNLGYRLTGSGHRLDMLTNFELSGDRLLGRAEGYYTMAGNYNYLKLYGKFENKSVDDDPENSDQGYRHFHAWLKGKRRLSKAASVFGKVGFEKIGFDQLSDIEIHLYDSTMTDIPRSYYNYDYSILSGRVGGSFALTDFSQRLDWRAEYSHRQVPDSTAANYDQYLFGVDYSYLGLSGYFSLEAEGSLKDYRQPGGGRDFYSFTSNLRGKRSLGSRFGLATAIQLYGYRYRVPDIGYSDFLLSRFELSGSIDVRGWESGPLFRWEYRNEANEDGYSEEYRQWELGAVSDYLGGGGRSIIFIGEATYGKRQYLFGGTVLSPYHFISTSVMVGCSISEHIRLDLLFDGSFETHQRSLDDSNLYLFSIGVSTRF